MASLDSIYGRGWAFPPAFTLEDGVVMAADYLADIQQSLRILFNTLPAERVMHPWFGCDLHSVMFENVTAYLLEQITALIRTSIEEYEPRVMLIRVEADFADVKTLGLDDQSGFDVLRVQVSYRIRGMESTFLLEGLLDIGDGQGSYFR